VPSIYDPEFAEKAARSADVILKDFKRIGSKLIPLFCVSVHEHTWMSAGYGVWGKEEYLKRFWKALDWFKVCDSYNKFTSAKRTTLY